MHDVSLVVSMSKATQDFYIQIPLAAGHAQALRSCDKLKLLRDTCHINVVPLVNMHQSCHDWHVYPCHAIIEGGHHGPGPVHT